MAGDPKCLGNDSGSGLPVDVHNQIDRERDRFAGALMRETHVRRNDAVRESRECLTRGICVDCTDRALVTGVQSLQQVEGFSTANLANQNPIRPVPQRRPQQVRDRDGWHRSLLAERLLQAASFEPHQIRFVDSDFGRLFDEDNPIRRGDGLRERVQQRA